MGKVKGKQSLCVGQVKTLNAGAVCGEILIGRKLPAQDSAWDACWTSSIGIWIRIREWLVIAIGYPIEAIDIRNTRKEKAMAEQDKRIRALTTSERRQDRDRDLNLRGGKQ